MADEKMCPNCSTPIAIRGRCLCADFGGLPGNLISRPHLRVPAMSFWFNSMPRGDACERGVGPSVIAPGTWKVTPFELDCGAQPVRQNCNRKDVRLRPPSRSVLCLQNSSSRIIRFSTFEIDLHAGELRQRGQKVKLQEQPLQILAALLERPGELVTREELRCKLWPADTFVDFDHGLNAAVKRLRDALGESAERPIFVETVARRGYRFIAPVNGSAVPGKIGIMAAPEGNKSSADRKPWWEIVRHEKRGSWRSNSMCSSAFISLLQQFAPIPKISAHCNSGRH